MTELLLPSVAQGDSEAVQRCLARYGGLVWSLARRACPNVSDAEDAVQDIFIDLWKNADRYNPELASETTFVALVARRRLIDRQRRQTRRPEPEPLDDRQIAAEPGLDRLELGEEVDRARDALAQLRDEQRDVLKLAIQQGLSHSEISARTGLPLGTVKTHVRRGLIRVRALLGQPAHAHVDEPRVAQGGTR